VEREKPDWLDVDAYEKFLSDLPFECIEEVRDFEEFEKEKGFERRVGDFERIFERIAECLTERKKRDKHRDYASDFAKKYCTEALAIYCASEDAIYYNTDRVLEYIDRLSKLTALHFVELIAQVVEPNDKYVVRSLLVYLLKPTMTAFRTTVANIVYTYLASHERYHWSMKQHIADEEAKATAYGLYMVMRDLIQRFQREPRALDMHIHIHTHPPDFPRIPAVLLDFLLGEIAVHILIAQHFRLKSYRDFTRYLSIKQKGSIKPMIKPPYIRNGGIHFPLTGCVLFNRLWPDFWDIILLPEASEFEFEFKAERSGRRDLVREYWGCCEKPVDYSKPVTCSGWGFA